MATFTDGATPRLLLRFITNVQTIKLTTRNAAGTLTDLATATGSICAVATVCKLDIHVVYSTTGSVDVYNNGVNILTFSGDVTTNSATTLSKFSCCNSSTSTSTFADTSELQVRTDDTRSLRMVTLAPVAAGNTQAWTGVVGSINETTLNDAANINDGTGNLKSQWTVGSLPAGTLGIKDVIKPAFPG
jgi:hypothetical protein